MRAQLAAHVGDVLVGPCLGVDAALDGGVLGRQAEGVEADREEHVVAAHAHVAGAGIRGRHGVPVPDVQVAGGVGQHGQGIELGARGIDAGAVQLIGLPLRLPLGFDGRRLIALGATVPFSARTGCCGFGHACPPLDRRNAQRPSVAAGTKGRSAVPPCLPPGRGPLDRAIGRTRRRLLPVVHRQGVSRAAGGTAGEFGLDGVPQTRAAASRLPARPCGAWMAPAGRTLPGSHPPRLAGGWPTTLALASIQLEVDPVGFEPTTFSMPLRRAPNCAMGPGDRVDLAGFEPATSSVRLKRAPNCATGPRLGLGL